MMAPKRKAAPGAPMKAAPKKAKKPKTLEDVSDGDDDIEQSALSGDEKKNGFREI